MSTTQTERVESILEQIKVLTVLEVLTLVEEMERAFNIDTSAKNNMVMMASGTGGGEIAGGVQEEEKTEFDIVLEKFPSDKKIAILKVVRGLTGLGLKEAKAIVESVPKTIKEAVGKAEADDIKKQLEEAGAEISLK